MNKKIKSVLTLILGWTFIFLGILGLFLPFLQGILFILIGLYILSKESPTAKKILEYVRKEFPFLHDNLEKAKYKAKLWIKKLLNIK